MRSPQIAMNVLGGKVVLVAGGAGLLGAGLCRGIVQYGGVVCIADCNEKGARALQEQIAREFGATSADWAWIDITSKAAINSCLEKVRATHGRLDAVVNAAYPRTASWGKAFLDVEYDDFCENINMQLGGAFLLSQQAAAMFIRQGYGNIIQMASIQGIMAPRFDTYEGTSMTTPVAYAVLKAGLIHLARYMAKYFKGRNIRVNTISPGGILDNQPESFLKKYEAYASSKGMLDPKDIAGALVFLLSDASSFVNGQNIVVDDGFSL
jgi:NAD(P)-dependent dehydrogenase (short-subunit alcohol dehydrogenase family)